MKITIKRFLALALCAAMLFGMLPMQQVKATESTISEVTVPEEPSVPATEPIMESEAAPLALEPDEWGNYNFYTMEQLKQLASQTYDSWTWAYYAGEEPFVIDESISLPSNLPLGSNGAAIEIAEGVVVNVHEGHFDSLVVNGTLNIDSLQLYTQLDVNGVLNIGNSAYFNIDAVINGAENISYANDDVTLGYWCKGNDLQSLKETCILAENETDPRVQYVFYLEQEETLSEDLTVPENVFLQVRSHLTVASGATLTLNADVVHMYAPVTVYGGLQHNGWANVQYPNAMLTIAEGATYSGDGILVIHGISEGDPLVAIPGLDTTGYELQAWEDGTSWQMVPEGYNSNINNGLTFATVEELKALIAPGLDPWTSIFYIGEGPLVIDETIVCPEYLMIHASEYEVRIGENGNLTVQNLYANKLVVEGTLNVAAVGMQTSLNVTGTMNVKDIMHVQEDTELNGLENICFQHEYTYIFCDYSQVDKARMLELVEQAKQNTDPRWLYVLNMREEIVLDQDLVIPSNVQWYLDEPVTVAAGATLTVYCYNVICNAPMTVEGTLENNSWIMASAYNNVTITFGADSTYTGSGTIAVEKDPSVSLEEVLPGLDLSSLYVRQDGDYWWYISTTNNSGGDSGMQTFTSFEELKELAAQSWDNWSWITYAGEGDLEITEDITIPENLNIQAFDSGVRIAEGVSAQFGYLHVKALEVAGDLHAAHVSASEYLTITGTLTVEQGINITEHTELSGRDKIVFSYDWSNISVDFYNVDLERLKELNEEVVTLTDSRVRYIAYTNEEEIVIEESLTLVNKLTPYFQGPLTVASGATLTLNCNNSSIYAPSTVYGTLENNAWLYVAGFGGATLTFAEGSVYTGTGTIAVEKDPSVALEEVLPGLDLSSLYLRQDGDWWTYISTTDNSGGGNDGLTFSSIDELKELASQTYDNWTWAYYGGEETLVIDESITLPENLQLQFHSGAVEIAAGVTVDAKQFICDKLVVNGTLNVESLNVHTELEINGTMTVSNSIYIQDDTVLSGLDNIVYEYDWIDITTSYQELDLQEAKELIARAEAETNPRRKFNIYLDQETVVLDESLTFPSNTNLIVQVPLTVPAGMTLTLNCENVNLHAPVTVHGAIVNNGWLLVNCDMEGLLTIAEGGSYSGKGSLAVSGSELTDPSTALPGVDIADMEVYGGDGWWNIYPGKPKFSSFEELKELAKETYDVYTEIKYTGEGPLVISEDFAISENVYIWAENADVVIEDGVTADLGQMYVNNLEVKGTVNAVYFFMNGDLTVTGKLNIRSGIGISQISNVTGYQNIVFAESLITLTRVFYVTNQDELWTALSAAENPTWPRECTDIQIRNDLTLTENMTVPKDTNVYAYANVTVAENAVLTVNGYWLQAYNMTVEGTLVNNTNFAVQGWGDGHLTIAEGGKYEGRGYLRIFGDKEDPMVLLSGLNADDFQISNDYGTWILLYTAGLTPVAAPSDLTWGYAIIDGEKVAMPGAASWKSGLTDSVRNEYIWFYRINGDGTEERINQYGILSYDAKDTADGYFSSEQLLLEDLESGKYYFTVSSAGDYETTTDGEIVKSEIWEYTKPNAQLNACANIEWSEDSFKATWTNTNSDEEVYAYIVNWYYKAQADSEEYHLGWIPAQGDDYCEIDDYTLLQIGTGYYSFTVHPVSADITKACNGPVSERSEWYHLEQMPDSPTVQLGNLLLDNTKTDEEKLEEVQQMGAETLKTAIEENANALSIVSQLEEYMAGGTAEVEISDEVVEEIEELVVEEISIIGANLNSKENAAEEIKLVIDKVEEVREITGNYEASTAVQFSMTLENVKDAKNLEVPVIVTLPVPEGLDPEKIVVLHYHDDGTYDVITPEVSVVGGKTYAQFVLTSFSDFAILEKLAALLGDVDLSEEVNVDDVLALLWYVLFPDEYPIGDTAADFDGSGDVNVDDVLALLWHVLFPEEYPLG